MAHGLTFRNNGTVEMAYLAGVDRWHGLGNELQAGDSIEDWIASAGMDWEILRAQVRYAISAESVNDPSMYKTFKGKVVLHRSDNKMPLGVVSTEYKPVQPKEVLEFFRDISNAAGCELTTAGTLFGGKRMWGLARMGDFTFIKNPMDKIGAFLLLSTACDGSMQTELRYTDICVVCNNTLGFARENKECVKVSHRTVFDADVVKAELGIENAKSRFQDAIAEFRALADCQVTPDKVVAMTGQLLHPGFTEQDADKQAKILRSAPVTAIGELSFGNQKGAELDGRNGTAWGWLNAVTEYVDHHARASSPDHRMNNALFGKGEVIKERAKMMAMELIGGGVEYVPVVGPQDASEGSSLLDDVLAATQSC